MKSGAAFLLAILLAIFLAYGSFGSSSDDSDSDHSNSASSSDDKDDSSQDDSSKDDGEDKQASDGHDSDKDDGDKDDGDKDDGDSSHPDTMKQRLEDEGLHVQQSSSSSDGDCAAHSYGQVSTHLQQHPCSGLDRAWYEVSDGGDNTAIVSVAWVEMPDANSAAELQTLVDRPGTGNVTELSKDDGPHQGVGYSGWYYRSSRDGDTFSSVQAEPLENSDGARDVARRASGAAGAA